MNNIFINVISEMQNPELYTKSLVNLVNPINKKYFIP